MGRSPGPTDQGLKHRGGRRPPASSYPTPITDVGHGPMNFGPEAGPPRYTVNPLGYIANSARRRKK